MAKPVQESQNHHLVQGNKDLVITVQPTTVPICLQITSKKLLELNASWQHNMYFKF